MTATEPDDSARWRKSSKATESGLLPESAIEALWAKLARMYGHRWRASFGASDDGTWRACLRDVTAEQLAVGLRGCVGREDGWPPTAPEFRALCHGGQNAMQRAFEARRLDAEAVHRAALPSPEQLAAFTATGRQWLAFWWREGLRKRPEGVTDEDIAKILEGADVDAMLASVDRAQRMTGAAS